MTFGPAATPGHPAEGKIDSPRFQTERGKALPLEFESHDHYVIEIRLDELAGAMVRCTPRRMSDFHDSLGKPVLLHASRAESAKGYFGQAVIDGYEPDPRGHWMFVSLAHIVLFPKSVSTMVDHRPRENAPLDANGRAAFSFYSNGLRSISRTRFEDIVDASGAERLPPTAAGLSETSPSQAEGLSSLAPRPAEEHVVELWTIERRRARARHRARLILSTGAFCCMSGASFDIPGGVSLLQVSHFWPLGHHGPDVLTNVGLMTANIHPIYENGLVTVRSDYSLRFAPDIPPGFLAEFRGRTRLSVPGNASLDPAAEYLAYHREEIFTRRLRLRGLPTDD